MYPSTAELVAASSVAALTDLDAAQQDALRAEAITAVEAYTGQSFTQEGTTEDPVTKVLDGTGGRTLALPRRLASLATLGVDGAGITVDDVVVSDRGDRLSLRAGPTGGSWADRTVAELEGARSRVFASGPGSVRVSGVWGWEECPDAVVTALRFHMEDRAAAEAHKLAETVRAARGLGLADVRQGNVTFTLGAEPLLCARAKREISDYVWRSPIGVVV